ncbi:quaternary amine ABC transporter ATP-binding protein [Aureimonas leprariae]|uniref:Quaternary amine transport ATP-binding protein n=1 Tax=Plantimonas leprariae TaxID=2615207 RepID=A0A7V7U1U3_9HYPH|nr:glycine betaine/L-proline ABC transporter ATP-binding protein [Aureimonas leprariae]KAB0682658.1 glycine betaine/L-proline ABC transporter ATP-binding protein [Aureimonas leprariae]
MPETTAPSIEIRHLYKIFGANGQAHVEAVKAGMTKAELNAKTGHVLGLRDIGIAMPGGAVQVIMGLSGSGKSTLIRHVNRLIDPTSGEVVIDGTDVVKLNPKALQEFRRHRTAMVFQKFALLPHRNVLENTVYGLEIQGLPRAKQVDAAMRWIERVGLKGFEQKYPNQLSGGMQQRVGLARALANDAPILLMDEAFSALDPLIRTDMQTVLLDIQKDVRKTIVFITHDLDEALRLGDRIAILRDGEMVQQGTRQDIVLRPADDYIAEFVRHVNRGRVIAVEGVMTPGRDAVPTAATVAAGTTLEAAAEVLAHSTEDALDVVDGSGERIGRITLRQIVAAMATPHGAKPASVAPTEPDVAPPPIDDETLPPLENIGRSVVRAQAG